MIRMIAWRFLTPAVALVAASLVACTGAPPPINVLAAAEQVVTVAAQAVSAFEASAVCQPLTAPACQSVLGAVVPALEKARVAIDAAAPTVEANPNGAASVMADVQLALLALQAIIDAEMPAQSARVDAAMKAAMLK